MNEITIKAHAKINTALDVTGLRDDGYHEVRMILQQIGLHDVITLKRRAKDIGSANPSVTLRVTAPLLGEPSGSTLFSPPLLGEVAAQQPEGFLRSAEVTIPSNSTNLACRAAQCLIDACGIREGVVIHLEKNIPAAAGLAGGSTDAAAVLKGMNELFELGLSDDDLCRYALSLGADVPYCVRGGGQLAEGIGEILTPLAPMPPCHILLVKPPEGVSTGAVYRALDAVSDPVHPDVGAAINAYAAGDLPALCAVMGNILETVTLPMLPRLSQIKSALYDAGACGAMMSGSGSTMFGLFKQHSAAAEAANRLAAQYPDCRVILTQPAGGHTKQKRAAEHRSTSV